MLRLLFGFVLVVSVVGCETDDGTSPAGSSMEGAAGATAAGPGEDPAGGEDGPGSDQPGAAVGMADPDASGPGTEPPLEPAEGAADGVSDAEGQPVDRTEPVAPASEVPAGGSADGAMDVGEVGVQCDLAKTRTFLEGDTPVVEGDLCDDVVICVNDAGEAAALMAVAAGFECSAGENPMGLCDEAQLRCIWRPSVLDAAEAAQVCAVTGLLPESGELVCIVYL